jgi:hypothetical protein
MATSSEKKGNKIGKAQSSKNGFADPSDLLAPSYSIELYHVPTGTNVKFKGFVTSFSDSYSSNWNTEESYGRMDPITTFQNTARTINIEWDVIAAHEAEARNNMAKCESLFRMLYPTYLSGEDSAGSIASAPLFKVKFGNLISRAGTGASADAATSGLLGTLGGFEYAPDFDAGFFLDAGAMFPQTISLTAEMQVLHNFPVGWKAETNDFRTKNYPYGQKTTTVQNPPTAAAAKNPTQAKKAEKKMTSPGKGAKK